MFNAIVKSRAGEDISILVQPENHHWNYLCECGDASDLTVKEVQNAAAVFISHTHIDHFVNFDAVIRHQIGIERRVVICGPEGIAEQVTAKLHAYTWNLIQEGSIVYEVREFLGDEIKVYEIEPPIWELKYLQTMKGNVLFEAEGFEVTGVLLDHKISVMAYQFKEKDTVKIDLGESGFRGGKWINNLKTAYENGLKEEEIEVEGKLFLSKDLFHLLHVKTGDTLGVIMDHAANAENHAKIAQHFKGCRRVYIECFYLDSDRAQAEANFHSYASASGKVMAKAEIGEAVPVHFSRRYSAEEVMDLMGQFESAFAGAELGE